MQSRLTQCRSACCRLSLYRLRIWTTFGRLDRREYDYNYTPRGVVEALLTPTYPITVSNYAHRRAAKAAQQVWLTSHAQRRQKTQSGGYHSQRDDNGRLYGPATSTSYSFPNDVLLRCVSSA